MNSTTLRRSNITKEKIAMMEALSRYNQKHQNEDFYKNQNKTKELDMLWQSFGVKPQKTEKAPQVYFVTGGGTGGHIYPAVAVGFALQKEPDTKKVYYIGNPNNLEKKIAEDKVFDF